MVDGGFFLDLVGERRKRKGRLKVQGGRGKRLKNIGGRLGEKKKAFRRKVEEEVGKKDPAETTWDSALRRSGRETRPQSQRGEKPANKQGK